MAFPRHARDASTAGGGTFVIPNTVAMVAGCPHPDEAGRFIAWFLADATERQLAEMPAKHAPLVGAPREGDLVVDDPLVVDPAVASAVADAAVEAFLQSVRDAAGSR
jgi:ABC-type Fe3+ transport system substrate-binding protein